MPLRILAYPAFERAEWNPYNALLYSELVGLGHEIGEFSRKALRHERWDILHLHWPQFFIDTRSRLKLWKSIRKTIDQIDMAKARGVKVVWTVHNAQPHETYHPRLESQFWTGFTDRLDGIIALGHSGIDEVQARWPALKTLPSFVIPHGHYRDVYPRFVDRGEARRRLGIKESSIVIAWLGLIRAYKNVPALIEAFRAVDDVDAVLSICGKPLHTADGDAVRSAAANDPRVRLQLKFLQNFEVSRELIAADVMVLPYASILNSGGALLGLSLDRPIVVPALGAMPELQAMVGRDWVQTYEGAFSTDALRRAIDWARNTHRSAAPLDAFDWPILARQTASAYAAIISGGINRDGIQ